MNHPHPPERIKEVRVVMEVPCFSLPQVFSSRQNTNEEDLELSVNTPYHIPVLDYSAPKPGSYYQANLKQQLIEPIRFEGTVWHLPDAVDVCVEGTLTLYANGISFTAKQDLYGSHSYFRFAWLPHSFVRQCALQLYNYPNADEFAHSRIFMIGVQSYVGERECDRGDIRSYYFGLTARTEEDCTGKRRRWMDEISSSIQQVTLSLFPSNMGITTRPGSKSHTKDLLIAGFLLLQMDAKILRPTYCVLYPQTTTYITWIMFDDETCTMPPLASIKIDPRTPCYEKMGHNSCAFVVDEYHFSARSSFERRIWLRALCNLKVKIQSAAPYPKNIELNNWRYAIQEHMDEVRAPTCEFEAPVFTRCAPPRIPALQGDEPPAPMEEEDDIRPKGGRKVTEEKDDFIKVRRVSADNGSMLDEEY